MAKVLLDKKRELEAGYHIYTLATPSGDLLTLRRKVAMPTDVQHSSSSPTRRQRHRFGAASKRWSRLPSVVKLDLANKYGFVDQRHSPTKSVPTVLQGRQLFIAQEIHQEQYHQEHADIPLWVCIQTIDDTGRIIDAPLSLVPRFNGFGKSCPSYYLSPGNTLFYSVPESDKQYNVGSPLFAIIWRYPNNHTLQELQKGLKQVWCPRIFEDGQGPYSQPTSAEEQNWQYFPAPTPQILCIVDVHEHDGTGWYNFFPYPMATFYVRRLQDPYIYIDIIPNYFNWDNCFSYNQACQPPVFWQVHVTAPGQWTLDPPQQSLIFDWQQEKIVRYEP
jgi:hypothetical protein